VVKAALDTGAIVVAEEHLAQGGLGSRIAQVVARERPVPMSFLNLKDAYAVSGKPNELLERCGLTAANLVQAVGAVIRRK
ncbi:MAG: transketolase family protein, partial [Chloroflexi bacterium]|nr:transketolase family protein [Chloroflexota bacterium]